MNGKPLFKPITVDLLPSDILFITGKNGVGKSTLINFILNPVQYDTVGDYTINLPDDMSFIAQQSFYSKDNDQLFKSLTKSEKEKFLYLLYKLGMDKKHFHNNKDREWSDGEKKKVLIAQSLMQQNSLFIWDEITNYLDYYVVDQLIETLANARPTMICIDYNEYFKNALATQTIHLEPI
ncbi:ATP-binding cassette domain-containing protein [Staphylococcus lutrae]|uniref:ABC transporter domain-containing protein n=2 Tax=Staphylococcus lutrae TaxID=155085 RepID=A0AAC9WMW7_9STAP|nr:ATP-binding cassette domain-containing protein [Staphylococcus lutrae]ARJ51767.1 hypothetical protein B5P37_10790 [Staphylococcus lutrae]